MIIHFCTHIARSNGTITLPVIIINVYEGEGGREEKDMEKTKVWKNLVIMIRSLNTTKISSIHRIDSEYYPSDLNLSNTLKRSANILYDLT